MEEGAAGAAQGGRRPPRGPHVVDGGAVLLHGVVDGRSIHIVDGGAIHIVDGGAINVDGRSVDVEVISVEGIFRQVWSSILNVNNTGNNLLANGRREVLLSVK